MKKEELKYHIEKRYSECHKRSQGLSYGSFYDGYMDCYCEQQKRIAELEKENAELEERLLQERETYWGKGFKCAEKKYKEQLTKAKDILRRLIEGQPPHSDMCEEADLVGWREVNKEAEQFLNSEVEK